MRRKERELTEEQTWAVIDGCTYGVVSMLAAEGTPYGVPVNIVRKGHVLYFHSAMEGYKKDCMEASPQVCVTFVADDPEIDQPGLTTRYASAILRGRAEEVRDPAEKAEALRLLCQKLAPQNPYGKGDFQDCIGHTAVWRITAESVTGKANRSKPHP